MKWISRGSAVAREIASNDALRVGTIRRLRFRAKTSADVQYLYSHSIVAGGFDEMSYTTRFTPFTSLMIRVEMRPNRS